jgi:hypothetical protein
MSFVRLLLATTLGVAVLAGCSGSDPAGTAEAAAPAPADASVYATVDSDRESAQWRQLEELLGRVPGGKGAVDELLSDALDEAGLDWEDDVAPALGPELAVVLPAGASQPVALTQSDDEDKLDDLLTKSDEKLVSREIGGWTAVAESEAALDRYESALKEGSLSDQAQFTEAMAGLPEDALARVYVRGQGLDLASLGASVAGVRGAGLPSTRGLELGTLALAVVAEDNGIRLTGTAQQDGLPPSFSPKLLGRVPADALLAATFKGGDQLTGQVRKSLAGAGDLLKTFEQQLGVSLDDVVSLLAGEGVLYVRPGLPIPELTFVLAQTDPNQAATVGALFRSLATASKAQLTTDSEDGVMVTRLALGPISVGYAATDGLLVVTTGRGGIAALRGDKAKLVDDPSFRKATEEVGYDGSTSGLVYADVDGLVPLLQGLAGLAGGSTSGLDDVTKTLGALDSLALNVTTKGDQATLEGVLAVR